MLIIAFIGNTGKNSRGITAVEYEKIMKVSLYLPLVPSSVKERILPTIKNK
jgi:hypothetical protein